MKIDNQLLDTLSAQAKANPRLRQSYDLRTTPEDKASAFSMQWNWALSSPSIVIEALPKRLSSFAEK